MSVSQLKFSSPQEQREDRDKQFKKKCTKTGLSVVDYAGPLSYRGPAVRLADFSQIDRVRQAASPLHLVHEQDSDGTWIVHVM